ncbi:DUF4304 domain-containing protein [Mucilaginibacter sp. KACC 22773]|uniref:DUF4304 domain-containing protein n=1 Tax=Mucilaginibacter sp. KACC 22773 TaxID=3025671 RepID=UPI002365B2D6|nr:DUF4304 domain-containing protein [Mucilaginibacter sp. KACC 22773]WDF76392.1 DUF4304 domain-containing protein [Mucilaginibacter sp. KACC 22773]
MERDLTVEFKTLVKNIITPQLKQTGFKKKNLNFNCVFPNLTQSLNVQKSQYNHSESIRFTINLGFYNSLIFKISKDRVDEPQFVTSDNCFIWGRTGMLIYNSDYWYELDHIKEYEKVSKQIENDLKNHVLPLFTKLQTLDALLDFIRIDYKYRPFHLIANIDDVSLLELEFGDYVRGRTILKRLYNEAIIPKSTKHTTVHPDGREDIRWSEPSVNDFHVNKLIRIAKKYKIDI